MDLGDVLALWLLCFLLILFALAAVLRFAVRVSLSLWYFMCGVIGLVAIAPTWFFGLVLIPIWADFVIAGVYYLTPLWFSIGARRSLEESNRRGAKALRWLNIVGFAVSVGLMLWSVLCRVSFEPYPWVVLDASAVAVVLVFSRVVLSWPPTRSRWAGVLPGYPAILLVPAVLVAWAMLWMVHLRALPWTGWDGWGMGFPLIFYGYRPGGEPGPEFRVVALLVDLLLAAASAWVLAWGADRLVLRWVLPRRGGQPEPRDPTRSTAP